MDINKPLNIILGIKTTSISRYSTEEEIIFLNTRLPIIKTSIKSFDIDNDENDINKINKIKRKRILFLLNYLKDLNDIITNKIKFFKKIGCQINDINNYIDMILKDDELYQLLFIKSSIKIGNKNIYIIDRLINELKLLFNINKFIKSKYNELIIPSFSFISLSFNKMNKIYNNIKIFGKLTTKNSFILKLQAKNNIIMTNCAIIQVNGKGYKGGKQSDPLKMNID